MVTRALLLSTILVSVAPAADLVPLPVHPESPRPAFEANKGQAAPDILLLTRVSGIAIRSGSIEFSPADVTMTFEASQSTPVLRLPDPLPGRVNSFIGSDPSKWVRDIPRYASATVENVLPNIDVRYAFGQTGFTATLICRPGADLQQLRFTLDGVASMRQPAGFIEGELYPAKGTSYVSIAASGADLEIVDSHRFRVVAGPHNPASPFEITLTLGAPSAGSTGFDSINPISIDGATFRTRATRDATGTGTRFPGTRAGCGLGIYVPYPCQDTEVSRVERDGTVAWISYFGGAMHDSPSHFFATPGGLAVVGTTDSVDFPVAAGAYRTQYAGPPAQPSQTAAGDHFALAIDRTSGDLLGSTYAGSAAADQIRDSFAGRDGSLYIVSLALAADVSMSVVRLDPTLSDAIYETRLPSSITGTQLAPDGSLVFVGSAEAGFPVTPNAFQRQPAGGEDAFVGRLAEDGSRITAATYIGTPLTDRIRDLAVSPGNTIWVSMGSFNRCCPGSEDTVVHLSADLSTVSFSRRMRASVLGADDAGNVILHSEDPVAPSPDALVTAPCGPAIVRMNPAGDILFATYLSAGSRAPRIENGRVLIGNSELIENAPAPLYFGCTLSAASYDDPNAISPGQIVSIFGSKLGPQDGVAFNLIEGRLPVELGGTRVLLNGEAVPLLYASSRQVNAVIPFSIPEYGVSIVVETRAGTTEPQPSWTVRSSAIRLFSADATGRGQAAAVNQDGTLNSASNPAPAGSAVMLFGTGGGVTSPPSEAGGITPPGLRHTVDFPAVWLNGEIEAPVEYSGAAPGQVGGVNQINIRLPHTLPAFPDPSAVPVWIRTGAGVWSTLTTIAVRD